MKKVILFKLLLTATIVNSQPSVQPLSSGDYWKIDEYQNRLPELANNTTFPTTLVFSNGSVAIKNFKVNRLVKQNEITWNIGTVQNVENFVIEWSRDLKTFERAGQIRFVRTEGRTGYVFRHVFEDDQLVYYRLGIVTGSNTIAYSPSVQVLDEEYNIKIYPTVVKGTTFYIQTAQAFEKLQVFNSGGQSMYEKGINGQTGTIPVGLPALSKGIYFVRLLSGNHLQHVQKILIE